MGYSGAGGKLIQEKNQKQKISWHCPFKQIFYLKTFTPTELMFEVAETACWDLVSMRQISAEFIDPWLGDKVNPMPELTLYPCKGSMNSATGVEPRLESRIERHNWVLNQFVGIPRRIIIVCYLALLAKSRFTPPTISYPLFMTTGSAKCFITFLFCRTWTIKGIALLCSAVISPCMYRWPPPLHIPCVVRPK